MSDIAVEDVECSIDSALDEPHIAVAASLSPAHDEPGIAGVSPALGETDIDVEDEDECSIGFDPGEYDIVVAAAESVLPHRCSNADLAESGRKRIEPNAFH